MTALLEIAGLTAAYGQVRALHGVDLAVGEGQVVALLGPNGAGKSTLLRAATGMVTASAGRITLDGRDLTGASIEDIARSGVAHVPEGRRLFAGLSVRDNLRLGGFYRENDDLSPVLGLFPKLGERLEQIAGSMSGGEQQMCAIARAMMSRPAFLLIDELSLGLAPMVVDEILARLSDIVAGGTGVLLVEQDAGAALEVAERAYVLENGRIALSGSARELADDARVRAAYLGV
jgi:branched-chain amino acid transport system ATP-binding protein